MGAEELAEPEWGTVHGHRQFVLGVRGGDSHLEDQQRGLGDLDIELDGDGAVHAVTIASPTPRRQSARCSPPRDLSRTDDGRILFGGRGAPYHYGSGIDPAFDLHSPTHDGFEAQLLEWFPSLAGIGFSGRWGGAVALSRDWLPTIAHDPVTGVAGAYGYGGQGVATAHLAGQVLAARIIGAPLPEGLMDLPLLDHVPRRWEPEPVRWLAVRYLQGALARLDARAARTGRAPTGRSPAERLTRH